MIRYFLAALVLVLTPEAFAQTQTSACLDLVLPKWATAATATASRHRKCDSNADCPGFANSCFAGNCTSDDSNQCNSNADCPGFANSCFAGHCTSQDDNQCNSNKDCPGFANSCFAGHCTNP